MAQKQKKKQVVAEVAGRKNRMRNVFIDKPTAATSVPLASRRARFAPQLLIVCSLLAGGMMMLDKMEQDKEAAAIDKMMIADQKKE